jgi:hypothetical protein
MQKKEKDLEKVVSKIEQNATNKCIAPHKDEWVDALNELWMGAWVEGIKQGVNMMVLRFIQNKRKRHFTKSQILKDLQTDFAFDEKEARRYMDETLAKAY